VRRKHSVVSHELRSDHIRFMVHNMQQIKAGLQMHIIEKPTIMRSCVFFLKQLQESIKKNIQTTESMEEKRYEKLYL
jgi:hypothetical protein